MIKINGAYGEGGGQILRSSLALSSLTGKPMHIDHIRANRSQPGLRPQHLAAVQAMSKLTNAILQGAKPDATALTFIPSSIRPGRYQFDIHTAGALSLLLQTLIFPLSFCLSHSRVTLTGGTHVPWSPIFHYLQVQWLPVITALGFRLDIELERAGFYPAGGGKVRIKILPAHELRTFTCVERGDLVRIRGYSGVANLEDAIAKRQKHQVLKRLYKVCSDTKIKTTHLPAQSKGTFILIKAEFTHCGSACFTALGSPGKPAERVADEAVDKMMAFLNTDGCVDHYMADQLILPLSLIDGDSQYRTNAITQHLLTNVYVIQQFLPVNIQIEGDLDRPGKVQVSGLGKNSFLQMV